VNPLLALLAIGAACWHAWRELAARVDGFAELLPLLLVLIALGLPLMARRARVRHEPALPLAALLMGYSLAVMLAPPIFCIAPAVLAMCYCLHAASHDGLPRSSFLGLVLLALPILPTLEFYTAYPVRLAAIEATAGLLRMNGVAVAVEGLALRFDAGLVQFDAPCSGVRMLWTCWFLASALAHLYGFAWRRYTLALLLATSFAVAGNILRATSLFYVEAGLLQLGRWPWLHEAVGLAAFVMTAVLLFVALRPTQGRCPRAVAAA
jgi:exosortase/archaeosortase family protein